jgi:L,D-peptidoglycan transpeptidase YkuD (ErfK/YbiS/YcfS/YnhG family)
LSSFLRLLLTCSIALTVSGCASLTREKHPFLQEILRADPAVKRQVLEVVPSGKGTFKATLTAWSCDQGSCRKAFGPWPAVIGKNGLAPVGEKREGDGRTPSGAYAIRTVFGTAAKFNTGLPYRQTMDDDIWVDDSASSQYNQWVKLPHEAASYEVMRRSDGLYDLGAVIEYNTDPVVPGHGSAIFLHIWRDNGHKPTAGCIALDRKHIQYLLEWLHIKMNPEVLLHE